MEGLEGYLCLGINILGIIYIVDTPLGTLQQRLVTFFFTACMHLTLLYSKEPHYDLRNEQVFGGIVKFFELTQLILVRRIVQESNNENLLDNELSEGYCA